MTLQRLPDVSLRAARRWVATHLYKLGASSPYLMRQLGHRWWSTTQHYIVMEDDTLPPRFQSRTGNGSTLLLPQWPLTTQMLLLLGSLHGDLPLPIHKRRNWTMTAHQTHKVMQTDPITSTWPWTLEVWAWQSCILALSVATLWLDCSRLAWMVFRTMTPSSCWKHQGVLLQQPTGI